MVHIYGQATLGDDCDIEGVRPVKQLRARRSRDRMLDAGQRLVVERAVDAERVADLARAAGCSVGAFYLRFRDKDAFFNALIAQYLSEGRAEISELFATHEDDQLIGAMAA